MINITEILDEKFILSFNGRKDFNRELTLFVTQEVSRLLEEVIQILQNYPEETNAMLHRINEDSTLEEYFENDYMFFLKESEREKLDGLKIAAYKCLNLKKLVTQQDSLILPDDLRLNLEDVITEHRGIVTDDDELWDTVDKWTQEIGAVVTKEAIKAVTARLGCLSEQKIIDSQNKLADDVQKLAIKAKNPSNLENAYRRPKA